MGKILSLGLTGKKLLVQGFLFVLLGLILMVTGTWLPVTVIRLVLFLSLIHIYTKNIWGLATANGTANAIIRS